ncbi:hypothetical protein CYMTET_30259 [Cymbomonas tetramitiformis]|uniref:Uncharacterized protein n=1 Tax=Cymbomonas tetramitiformis TaxID=36881 RepID=A0AAE0FJF7_9CHLO|nr:hypothetical protein CYMTET_30259 [Cymbomonas tetramitiformis]
MGRAQHIAPLAGIKSRLTVIFRGAKGVQHKLLDRIACAFQRSGHLLRAHGAFQAALSATQWRSASLRLKPSSRPGPRVPGGLQASLACITGALSAGPQEVFSLSLTPAEMSPALQGVPVWTVTNDASEFILVSGKGDSQKQLVFFCFTERDASTLLEQVRSKDTALGDSARVTPVTLDKVYELLSRPNDFHEGITFRFVPDPMEVQAALQVSRDQGDNLQRFSGVPVFQADGLTIKGGTKVLASTYRLRHLLALPPSFLYLVASHGFRNLPLVHRTLRHLENAAGNPSRLGCSGFVMGLLRKAP